MSQVTGYRDLSFYDAPGVALSQLAGGRFSLEEKADAFLAPEKLTPDARKTMAERMLGDGQGVLPGLVNIATNPFVLAMLFTVAPVGRALAKGRDPFIPAPGRGSMHQEYNPLAAAGLLGVSDGTIGGHASTTVGTAVEVMKKAQDGVTERTGVPLAKLMQALGIDSVDLKKNGSEKLRDLHRAAMVRLNQMEKAYAPRIVNMEGEFGLATKVPGKEGEWTREILGRTDDPAAVKKYAEAKAAREAWEAEAGELSRKAKKLKEKARETGDWTAKKELGKEWKELYEREPPEHFVVLNAKQAEKPAFEMKWAPDGREDALDQMASRIEERMPPEYFEWLNAMKAEVKARRDGLFQPEGGRVSFSGGKVFHGTRSSDLTTFFDKEGNLVLRPSSNFDGRTRGVSFSSSSDEAWGYATRVPESGGSKQPGTVFEIDGDYVVPRGRKQSDTEIEIATDQDVVIPKGRFRVVQDPELKAWEVRERKRLQSLSDKELMKEDYQLTNQSELAEQYLYNEDAPLKGGANPVAAEVTREMRRRVWEAKDPAAKAEEFASHLNELPYTPAYSPAWLKKDLLQNKYVAPAPTPKFEGGALPGDKMALRMLRSLQQRSVAGEANIMGPMDSAMGSFGRWGADEGVGMLFAKEHLNAIKVGATTKEEGLVALKKMMAGGDAFSDHYIPFNSFDKVVTEGMRQNRNLRAVDTSVLRAFDEDGMNAGMTAAKGLALSKKGTMPDVHPEDLRLLAESNDLDQDVRDFLRKRAEEVEEAADDLLKTKQKAMPALRINPFKSWTRYMREAAGMEVMLGDADDAMLAAQAASVRAARRTEGWEAPFEDPMLRGLGDLPTPRLDDELHAVDRTLVTREALLRNAILSTPDRNVQGQLRESFAGLTSRKKPESRVLAAAAYQMKAGVASFLDTKLGGWLAETVPPLGRAMVKVADPDSTPMDFGAVGAGMARFLYTTHLGLNMGSMMINLMQPAVMALPQLGVRNTLIGYKRAIGDMWRYAEERVRRYGVGMITPSQRQELLDEVLPHAREWGLGGDHLATLDAVTFGQNLAKKRGFFDKVEEVFLKGFEKTEWLNRMVTAHGFEAGWEVSGKVKSPAFFAAQKRYVATTQFTNSPENTPRIFLTGALSHPLVRQFLSFPVRTATGVLHTAPLMAEQESWGKGFANTMIRGLGMSAILYEVGKQVGGVDLSQGLFAASATDIVGGEKYLETGNGWLKLPPIVTIPHDFISGVAQDDVAMVSNSIARMVPGGVALNRALGVMPELGTPILDTMQKTHADWASPLEDGRVPVYKMGRLIDYKSPSELVMRGLGIDMGKFNEPGSLDGYLVKQREEILKARHEYLRRMAANDVAGAQKVAAEFLDKFEVPLTVSKAQVRAFQQSRQVPRTERILDRMPGDVRAAYAGVVAGSRGLNVPVDSLGQGGTSTSRAGLREATGEVDLERRVRAAMEQQIKGSQRESMEFGSFGA